MATRAQLTRVTRARGSVNAAWQAIVIAVLETDDILLPPHVLAAVDDYRTAHSELQGALMDAED